MASDYWANYRLYFRSCSDTALMVVALTVCFIAARADAQTNYTSADAGFGFTYPKTWHVEAQGGSVRVSADDAAFVLRRDVLASLPTGPPAYDSSVKSAAALAASGLLKHPEFVRAQTALVDHGSGAVFRYQETGDDSKTISIWIAIVGKHSVMIAPAKAGQPGESIGVSTIIQSLTFADALPPRPAAPTNGGSAPMMGSAGSGMHTVSFDTQIMPILQSRCVACHEPGLASGGLAAATYAEFMHGGRNGSVVTPGNPSASSLMAYLTGTKDRMPKGSDALSAEQIRLFRTWIAEGAWDGTTAAPAANTAPTARGAKMRAARAAARAAAGARNALPQTLMEAYSGHLAATDSSFTLRLNKDGTTDADWLFGPGIASRFTGTYTGQDGSYLVTLNQGTGQNPYNARSMVLSIVPRGGQEVGSYVLNTGSRHDVADLALTEVGVDLRNRPAAKAKRKKRPGT